ncbi:major facilitator superfamily domain-containing protein [Scheffersomyces xylosifermentans]|uniref:major facilitator superfamily domain-containing protein n=1 Tax=Scheffersomyces xylosifermentans TaxID=1304137 RepID=UPI00315CAA4A
MTTSSLDEEKKNALVEESEGSQDQVFIESNAGDGTRREDQYVTGYKLVLCCISLLLCLFLVAIGQTIVVTIITQIGNRFDGFDKINWLSSGFLLAVAVFTSTWGKLSIVIGRKPTLSIAIVLFELGSLVCALSTNMNMLIGGRVLAGIGGGGIQSLVFVILSEIVPIQYRAFGMMVLSLTTSSASVLGPLIGGALSKVDWRWCFYINLPIGGVAFVFLQLAFHPPPPQGRIRDKFKTLDYMGTVLVCCGSVLLLLGLSFGSTGEFEWNSSAVIACFILGGIFCILFCVWNFKYSKYPLIPPDIIQILSLDASVLAASAMFGYLFSNQIYLSVFFQTVQDMDGWHSGLHLLPMIIASVLSSVIGGFLFQKFRYIKPFSIFAAVCGVVGNSILVLLGVDSHLGKIIGLLILPGVSTGMQVQSTALLVQISAPKSPGSMIMATTFYNFARTMGGAIATDLATLTYSESLKSILRKAVRNEKNPQILEELSTVDLTKLISNTAILPSLTPETQFFLKTQILKSIRNVFHLGTALAAICLIATFFQSNARLPKKSKGADDKELNEKEKSGSSSSHGSDDENKA